MADVSEPEEPEEHVDGEDSAVEKYSAAVVREEARVTQGQESRRQQAFLAASSFTGPWPPPRSMAEYKEIDPSFPERIVKAWEDEAQHRRSLDQGEFTEFRLAGAHARRIQWAGFAVSTAVVLTVVVCAFVFQQYWLFAVLAASGGIGIGIRSVRRRPAAQQAD